MFLSSSTLKTKKPKKTKKALMLQLCQFCVLHSKEAWTWSFYTASWLQYLHKRCIFITFICFYPAPTLTTPKKWRENPKPDIGTPQTHLSTPYSEMVRIISATSQSTISVLMVSWYWLFCTERLQSSCWSWTELAYSRLSWDTYIMQLESQISQHLNGISP